MVLDLFSSLFYFTGPYLTYLVQYIQYSHHVQSLLLSDGVTFVLRNISSHCTLRFTPVFTNKTIWFKSTFNLETYVKKI